MAKKKAVQAEPAQTGPVIDGRGPNTPSYRERRSLAQRRAAYQITQSAERIPLSQQAPGMMRKLLSERRETIYKRRRGLGRESRRPTNVARGVSNKPELIHENHKFGSTSNPDGVPPEETEVALAAEEPEPESNDGPA